MNPIRQEAKTALILFMAFSVLTGLAYPILITGLVQTANPEKADGSLLFVNGSVVGSKLIGQNFTSPHYFHGRPSTVGYNAMSSGASNLGPTSSRLMDQVNQIVDKVRAENNMSWASSVPADLVMASGSGLDPHISVEGAMLQIPRVAGARGLPESDVKVLVYERIEPAALGILGQERVNVLELNLALDEMQRDRQE